jgi:glutathione-regulated potassium-efflux system protein KefB
VSREDAEVIAAEIRRRDAERFELEMASGNLLDGAKMVYGNKPAPARPTPTPFTKPKREARPLNDEAAEAIGEEE